ncbi:MAG TPA: hypothetical protein VGR77_04095 [Candidatus Dormibacteraeota bacterium]|nr:hypothetical protein [Candidatus Dormibacteraeota bacterium]
MKQPFWPQRPTAPGRSLAIACWLAALILAIGLAPGVLPGGGASAGAVVAAAQFDATVFQRRCAHRVIDLTQGKPEQYVIDQLNRQCFNRIQRPPPPASRACIRPVTWEPPVAMPRVFGCLPG